MPSDTPDISTWISTPQIALEFYATIRDQGEAVMHDVPVSGSLTWTTPGAVVRTGDIVFQTVDPARLAHGLAMGWTADVYARVAQSDTVYDVPLGRYRAVTVDWVPGSVNVSTQATDEIMLIADALYPSPFTARKGWSHLGALRRVCAVPGLRLSDPTHATIRRDHTWGHVPLGAEDPSPLRAPIVCDQDRLELFTQLNTNGRLETFCDKEGVLICRRPPAGYWRKRPGADHTMKDASLFRLDGMEFDRTAMHNQVVIQPTDTSEKFWYVQEKVTSGDYRYGPRFGARPLIHTADDIDTKAKARAAVGDIVDEYAHPAHRLTITAPPYWWIEIGDAIALPGDPVPRYNTTQVELPLGLGDMKLQLDSIDKVLYQPDTR